jgi:hypothetical protein
VVWSQSPEVERQAERHEAIEFPMHLQDGALELADELV